MKISVTVKLQFLKLTFHSFCVILTCLWTFVSWSRLFSRKEIFCFWVQDPPLSSGSISELCREDNEEEKINYRKQIRERTESDSNIWWGLTEALINTSDSIITMRGTCIAEQTVPALSYQYTLKYAKQTPSRPKLRRGDHPVFCMLTCFLLDLQSTGLHKNWISCVTIMISKSQKACGNGGCVAVLTKAHQMVFRSGIFFNTPLTWWKKSWVIFELLTFLTRDVRSWTNSLRRLWRVWSSRAWKTDRQRGRHLWTLCCLYRRKESRVWNIRNERNAAGDNISEETDVYKSIFYSRQSPPDPSSPVWSAHGAHAEIWKKQQNQYKVLLLWTLGQCNTCIV